MQPLWQRRWIVKFSKPVVVRGGRCYPCVNARRSLAGKLMVVMLVTTAIALASAGAALMYTDLRDNRAAWAEDLRTEAGHPRAGRHARAVVQRPRVRAAQPERAAGARIHSRRGAVRGRRQPVRAVRARRSARAAGDPCRACRAATALHIDGERVLVMKPVVQGGEVLGTIYLRAQYDVRGA